MGLFNWFKKKTPSIKKVFDEETYALRMETRKQERELRRLQMDIEIEELKQELDELRGRNGGDVDTPDDLMQSLVTAFLTKGTHNGQNAGLSEPIPREAMVAPQQAHIPPTVKFSRQQIEAFYAALPLVQRSMLKFAKEEDIKRIITAKIPNIDPETLDLCVDVARNRK